MIHFLENLQTNSKCGICGGDNQRKLATDSARIRKEDSRDCTENIQS